MKKNNRLIVKLFVAMVMLVGLNITGTAYVSANNHGDVRVSRWTNGDGGDYVTNPRAKQDPSSMYAYNDNSTKDIYVTGAASNGGNQYWTEGISQGTPRVPVGQFRLVYQKVFEMHYRYGVLVYSSSVHDKTWISFLWSPDSV
ncbi:hypothetical protein IGI37_002725 [Enterococcus sp. AZ194]|uniref:hypothetical protein n=1 Tax=Enterococcus sp. AZ194 TaxID=2774629 RepID=UPI003F2048C1